MQELVQTVLNWLTSSYEIFGVPCQNWMLVIAGGLMVYALLLTLARHRQPHAH